jgi:hypothetical protein
MGACPPKKDLKKSFAWPIKSIGLFYPLKYFLVALTVTSLETASSLKRYLK